ncbi:MAG: hypothetical protein WCA11_16975 [Terracidiphilus sp.]
MSPHNPQEPEDHKPEEIDASAGYEQSDVRVTGIVVFLTALAIFVAVIGVLSYGIGKVINARMNKEDGPTSKWTKTVNIRQLGNLPNNPEMQQKVAELAQSFPTPRLQLDDGNQDVMELHEREDLLLNNYSWVDRSKGEVRIPIERAMELIAQRGLPVAPEVQHQPLMTGDKEPVVVVPLTNGFARTSYEQEQDAAQAAEARQKQEETGTKE